MKKILSFILTMTMLLPSAACVKADNETGTANSDAEEKITVTVDGDTVEFDTEPIIENDRVLVPVWAIFEKLGAEVSWNEERRTVYAVKPDDELVRRIIISIGDNKMEVYDCDPSFGTDALLPVDYVSDSGEWLTVETIIQNRSAIELDSPAIIVNDRTLVPLRAISEAFGYDVEWEGETRTVTITPPETENADSLNNSQTAAIVPLKPDDTTLLMNKLPKDENYVISPLSLKMAMLMTANGADGDTKFEMLNTFNTDNLDAYNEQTKELIERLNSDKNGEVSIANSIWFNKDFYKDIPDADFSKDFEKIVSDYYYGTADTVTNKNSVERVNDWVKDKTNGKITALVPESSRKYLAALVNAIYMKADWINQFDSGSTYEETFTDINGRETEIEFMHQTDHFNYYDDGNHKVIELPYTNGLSMFIVLGEGQYINDQMTNVNLIQKKVKLSLPKFKIEYAKELNDILKALGIEKAFSDNAEFEKMVENVPDPVKIDKVLQKAIIEVDEKGTEAAAATFVGMVALSGLPAPEEIVEFKADKPFTYYIKDRQSGETLFSGRYVKTE